MPKPAKRAKAGVAALLARRAKAGIPVRNARRQGETPMARSRRALLPFDYRGERRRAGSCAVVAPAAASVEMLMQRPDEEIAHDVTDELKWDPGLDETNIAVTARRGIVTLA